MQRIGLRSAGVRFKGTAPLPGGTFRPLHPLRGGPGLRPQEQKDPGKKSVYGIANKLADYSQRGIVTVLFGMTVWGIYAMWDVHTHIMAKSEGMKTSCLSRISVDLVSTSPSVPLQEYEKRKQEGTLDEVPAKAKKPEWTLAEAAQKVQENKKPQMASSDS
ncbi:hypothetical protein FRB90_000225 [Tulasnella sp. 427]|nr:hypothetical protein FRB90_000225 [Tulasnella sp. 427]